MSIEDRMTGGKFCELMQSFLGPNISKVNIYFRPLRVIDIEWVAVDRFPPVKHTRRYIEDEPMALRNAVVAAANLNDEDWREIHISASVGDLALTVATMHFKPLLDVDWSLLENYDRQPARK